MGSLFLYFLLLMFFLFWRLPYFQVTDVKEKSHKQKTKAKIKKNRSWWWWWGGGTVAFVVMTPYKKKKKILLIEVNLTHELKSVLCYMSMPMIRS